MICTYRKTFIKSRGSYSFLDLFAAATIQGRLLFKGGSYYNFPKKQSQKVQFYVILATFT